MRKAMIEDNELKKWIESVHCIFEIFEGRYDAYPLAKKWVDEWFQSGEFTVLEGDRKRLENLKANFKYEAFGIQDNAMRNKINDQFTELLTSIMNGQRKNSVGFAISPYMFTWNFQRFKEYFRRKRGFPLSEYFEGLSKLVGEKKEELHELRKKQLVVDKINDNAVTTIFIGINNTLKQLGINQNEPVGTAKLLHILAPRFFPLIDNPIATAVGLKNRRESLTSSDYYHWMIYLQNWLKSRYKIVKDIEKDLNLSILKLVDEGFYVMSSINLSLRLAELGVIPRK